MRKSGIPGLVKAGYYWTDNYKSGTHKKSKSIFQIDRL